MSPQASIVPVYAVVPAAGLGRRMGLPKQTLPFRGSTIVGKVVRTLLDAELNRVVLVTRSELVPELDLPTDCRLRVAINADLASQMIDSIRIGLFTLFDDVVNPNTASVDEHIGTDAAAADSGILIVPGDMPGLSQASCRLCVQAFRAAPTRIIVATHAGQRGHPLVFPAALRAEIDQLQGGLNLLIRRHSDRVQLVETCDPGAVEDVDTWDQYRAQTSEPTD